MSSNLFRRYSGLGVMVLNATFNNISIISWLSVLSIKESGVTRENDLPAASHAYVGAAGMLQFMSYV
jgi:hypothetical protein